MALETVGIERMKSISKNLVSIGLVFIMVSCLMPNSKEAYLEKFERFVDRVEQNHKNYNAKDWEWANSQFDKYNHDWYLKFTDEFTIEDQLKIKSLIIRYHSYKNKQGIIEMLRDLFKDDVDEMGEKIEEYIDNNMEEDLEKLKKGATTIGDSAIKVLEDIIRELDESF